MNLFGFLQRKKEIHEIIASAAEIRDHLEWVLAHEVSMLLSMGDTEAQMPVRLLELNHSSDNGFVQVVRKIEEPKLVTLQVGDAVTAAYQSSREIRYLFQTVVTAEEDAQGTGWRLAYPSLVESFQNYHSVRFKNPGAEPIQVDLEKDRGIVIDIGLSGFQFTSNRILEKGQVLKDLRVELPRLGTVQGSGVVKYTCPASDYPLWRYRCGVEFLDLKPKDQRRLSRYVGRMMREQPAL
ncbi:MAG: PilZ domain-containing protein [bacterium]|nr:PilZ domain-containing protein [bacterium]